MRRVLQAILALWTLFWGAVGVDAIVDSRSDSVAGIIFSVLVAGLVAATPWVIYTWPSRTSTSERVPAHPLMAADHPADSPLGRLERITEAAAHLRDQGWITRSDHAAIIDRVTRLTDLTQADQQSVTLGGRTSPVVIEQIHELHSRVLSLLDAGIDSAAIEPGDADLDARLQHHLDVMSSRGQAIGEVEGRTDWLGQSEGLQQPGT